MLISAAAQLPFYSTVADPTVRVLVLDRVLSATGAVQYIVLQYWYIGTHTVQVHYYSIINYTVTTFI